VARDAGVLIAIDTDAHHPWQLDFVEYGLAAAAKAGIAPERVLNFRDAAIVSHLLKDSRAGRGDRSRFQADRTSNSFAMAVPNRKNSRKRRLQAQQKAAEEGRSIPFYAKEIAKELMAPSLRSKKVARKAN